METKKTLIRKPFELETQSTVKALVYGQPGSGKTTLALSAPKPLLLDFDGGIHRINPLHQQDTVQIKSWDNCLDVLKEDLSTYQTIVIDTAGKMLDFLGVYLINREPKLGKRDGSLTLQGFGARKYAFIAFLKQVSIMGKHIVFVAHDKEERGDGDSKIVRPEIGGSSAGDLIKELDLVGYLEMIGKKRTVTFDPCEKYYGKNTCNLDSLLNIPESTTSQNNFLSSVISQYQESLKKRSQMATEYSALMDLIGDRIELITDTESANGSIEWITGLDHIWDSKLQAGRLVNIKAKELNLAFNKETKS